MAFTTAPAIKTPRIGTMFCVAAFDGIAQGSRELHIKQITAVKGQRSPHSYRVLVKSYCKIPF